MARKMRISHIFGRAYGSYDGIAWFSLSDKGVVPYPERYYIPDHKYELHGRKRAIKDLRECFVP